MSGRFRWDFFISYCHEDKARVEKELVVPLIEKGAEVMWDQDREGAVASNLSEKLAEWVQNSQITVVVLSRAYAQAYKQGTYLKYEFDLAKELEVKTGHCRVVVVELDECEAPDVRMTNLRGKVGDERLIDALVHEVRKEGIFAFRLTPGGSALAVGAHWDDLLLGCLGTLLKLKRVWSYDVSVLVICKTYCDYYYRAEQKRLREKADRMYMALCETCGFENLSARIDDWGPRDPKSPRATLADRGLRKEAHTLNEIMGSAVEYSQEEGRKPFSLIFSPPIDDKNDDHAATAEAVFSSFRDPYHTILEYVIKRYTERELSPNVCVGLALETIVKEKERLIAQVCKVTDPDPGVGIRNSDRLFCQEALRARVRKDALDYAKDWAIEYAEVFRGRIEL